MCLHDTQWRVKLNQRQWFASSFLLQLTAIGWTLELGLVFQLLVVVGVHSLFLIRCFTTRFYCGSEEEITQVLGWQELPGNEEVVPL